MHNGRRRAASWAVLPRIAVLALVVLVFAIAPALAIRAGAAGPVVLLAVGDIAYCGQSTAGVANTAKLFQQRTDRVAILGDLAYQNGSTADFACYDRFYGTFLSRSYPTPGNHEYYDDCRKPGPDGGKAAPYFAYFNRPGVPSVVRQATGKGWYAYDLGSWRIVVLNSSGSEPRGDACGWVACTPKSEQGRWLKRELKAHRNDTCTLAYWHHPRFSSGAHGNSPAVQPFWQMLAKAGADVVLNGHAHNDERFAPQDARGDQDAKTGIRQFVVGTGGAEIGGFSGSPVANSLVRIGKTPGVLQLTLGKGAYSWEFIDAATGKALDKGSGTCH